MIYINGLIIHHIVGCEKFLQTRLELIFVLLVYGINEMNSL